MAKSAELSLSFTNDILPNVVVEAEKDLNFGQYLRRERILRGISRNEIIQATKVSDEYLAALENNQFDQLPPRAFVVGFLRTLSKYAGLDGDEVVNRFLAQASQQRLSQETSLKNQTYFKKHHRKILTICGVACLLILMFFPYFRHRF